MAKFQKQNQAGHVLSDTATSMMPRSRSQNLIPKAVNFSKKRIGPYSYNLHRVVGSGFSSTVYMGYKDNDKSMAYAIKVIELSTKNTPYFQMLKNEIEIMLGLNHPNILKLHDVYYTRNNCYLITQFCEGGTLQKLIDTQENIEWEPIALQIAQGCQYIAKNLLIHRDLKPSNVFLHNGLWKIGDFGFACRINSSTQILKEKYSIGSPLYMPLQTLENSIYSQKTDAFAFGVMMYYLVTKNYPWYSSDKASLVLEYKSKVLNEERLSEIDSNLRDYIIGLCKADMDQRLEINATLFKVRQNNQLQDQKLQSNIQRDNEDNTQSAMLGLMGMYIQQVKFCQFIYYYIKHINQQQQRSLLNKCAWLLQQVTNIWEWPNRDSLFRLCINYRQYTKNCENNTLSKAGIQQLKQKLEDERRKLQGCSSGYFRMLLWKTLEFQKMVRAIIDEDTAALLKWAQVITIYTDFQLGVADQKQIQKLTESQR